MTNQEKAKKLYSFVKRKIDMIKDQSDRHNDSCVRATLAKLRRGVGKNPGRFPDIWDLTLDDLPESFLTKTDDPSREEWATHIALTLFALHQQNKTPRNYDEYMNRSDEGLGCATRKLTVKLIIKHGKSSEDSIKATIKRRFDIVVTSDAPEEVAHHLRGLIQLLKGESIPLDYPQLAVDLFRFQSPESRDGVRLKWGQDYYYTGKDEENNDQETVC